MVSKPIMQHSQATKKCKPHSKPQLGRLKYKLNAIEQRRPSAMHEWFKCLDSVIVESQVGVPQSSPRMQRRVRFHDSPNTSVDDDTSNIILGLSVPPQRRSLKKPRRNSFVIRNLPRASALSIMGLTSLSPDQSDFSSAEQKTTLKQTSSTSSLQRYVTRMALGDE